MKAVCWLWVLLLPCLHAQPVGSGPPVFLLRQPEQVHLSWGQTEGSIVVMWVTNMDDYHGQDTSNATKHGQGMPQSNVWCAPAGTQSPMELGKVAFSGISWTFTDGGAARRQSKFHMATLTGLLPDTLYQYAVGDVLYGVSGKFEFRTMPPAADGRMARYVVFGDQGVFNAPTIPLMNSMARAGSIEAVLSLGDYAYDMDMEDGVVGDKYMRGVEGFAATVPFIVSMGNHEAAYGFSHYTERFRGMPATNGTVWSDAGDQEGYRAISGLGSSRPGLERRGLLVAKWQASRRTIGSTRPTRGLHTLWSSRLRCTSRRCTRRRMGTWWCGSVTGWKGTLVLWIAR
eukprot:TRINITY_DN3667_c0_g1_i4.p1 TRINITY_DN3667_c0_g1~~TRINITY_DN3667_c0_g1_i4.p1  ORF type:complete len:343 (+),score=35.13 TRINITY_DN3667_c0_g1_i4:214-1242(+)